MWSYDLLNWFCRRLPGTQLKASVLRNFELLLFQPARQEISPRGHRSKSTERGASSPLGIARGKRCSARGGVEIWSCRGAVSPRFLGRRAPACGPVLGFALAWACLPGAVPVVLGFALNGRVSPSWAFRVFHIYLCGIGARFPITAVVGASYSIGQCDDTRCSMCGNGVLDLFHPADL